MTDDLAIKMAALASELGKLGDDFSQISDDQQALIRRTCSPLNARKALGLAIAMVIETTPNPAGVLVDTALAVAGLLALVHPDARVRKVSNGEMLDLLARHADKLDAAANRLVGAVKAALARDGGTTSKPGSN